MNMLDEQQAATALDQAAGEHPDELIDEIRQFRDAFLRREVERAIDERGEDRVSFAAIAGYEAVAKHRFGVLYPHTAQLLSEAGR